MDGHRNVQGLVLALLVAVAGLWAPAASAKSETGVGNHFHRPFVSSLEVFEPLRRHDPDALRITEFRLSSQSWTIELYPDSKRPGHVIAKFALFDRFGDKGGWLWLNVRRSAYDGLAASVDDAMAESRLPPANDAPLVVCTDSGAYVVERRKNGATTWFNETCPDQGPAEAVAAQLVEMLPYPLCWYVADRLPASDGAPDPCEKVAPPGVQHEDGETNSKPAGAAPAP
jgi:hypothetical protein